MVIEDPIDFDLKWNINWRSGSPGRNQQIDSACDGRFPLNIEWSQILFRLHDQPIERIRESKTRNCYEHSPKVNKLNQHAGLEQRRFDGW